MSDNVEYFDIRRVDTYTRAVFPVETHVAGFTEAVRLAEKGMYPLQQFRDLNFVTNMKGEVVYVCDKKDDDCC